MHERCFRLIHNDKRLSYEELLENNGSVPIHHRNGQVFATEMYKFQNDLSRKNFSDLFC